MAIEFQCPRCQAPVRVGDGEAGKKTRCQKCQAKVRVPQPAQAPVPSTKPWAPPPASSSAATSRTVVGAAIDFACPKCAATIHVPGNTAGQKGYCPRCGTKVRVPHPEAALPPSVAFASLAIQFQCPRCDAAIHVPGDAAGTKGFCPQCGGKVLVPVPDSGTIAPPPRAVGTPPAVPVSPAAAAASFDVGAAISAPSSVAPIPSRPKKKSRVGIYLLMAAINIAAVAGGYYWMRSTAGPQLEGTLVADRLIDVDLGPFRVDNDLIGIPRKALLPVFRHLEENPLRVSSQFLILQFEATSAGVRTYIRPSDTTAFVRVDPKEDKLLSKFIDENAEKFDSVRKNDLRKALPEFIRAVERRHETGLELENLLEFRNSVGLASQVRGFGHHVIAVVAGEVYPCLAEDPKGRLYFALPNKVAEFELRGPQLPKDAPLTTPHFPGTYKVRISNTPTSARPEPAEPKKKKSNLFGDKPDYGPDSEEGKPDEMPEETPAEDPSPKKKSRPKKTP